MSSSVDFVFNEHSTVRFLLGAIKVSHFVFCFTSLPSLSLCTHFVLSFRFSCHTGRSSSSQQLKIQYTCTNLHLLFICWESCPMHTVWPIDVQHNQPHLSYLLLSVVWSLLKCICTKEGDALLNAHQLCLRWQEDCASRRLYLFDKYQACL